MMTQATIPAIMEHRRISQFSRDILWLMVDWGFQPVFRTTDNRISIMASPYCDFYVYVHTDTQEISYIDTTSLAVFSRMLGRKP